MNKQAKRARFSHRMKAMRKFKRLMVNALIEEIQRFPLYHTEDDMNALTTRMSGAMNRLASPRPKIRFAGFLSVSVKKNLLT